MDSNRKIEFGDISEKAKIGDTVSLQGMENIEVVACQETGVPMLNIDADQIKPGDLTFIKQLGLTISNPDTDKPVALGVDYTEDSFGHKVSDFFSSDNEDDDDSSFFGSLAGAAAGASLGGSMFGGGSSFGGFGGGGFSGGGASGGF